MGIVLYEKPLLIELVGSDLIVNGKKHQKSMRTLGEMKKVLREQPDEAEDTELYYMYRDVYHKDGIRFDITVIPARMLGKEYVKTKGHYHPGKGDGSAYPEVYQVLHGNAEFIMQKKNKDGTVDAMIVNAKEGDVMLVPPWWGHVTVNKGEDTLVLANLVYSGFESLYQEYENNRGAVFYYLKDGEIVQNTNYMVHKNEQLSPDEINRRYGFFSKDLLTEFINSPKKFEFLKEPLLLKS